MILCQILLLLGVVAIATACTSQYNANVFISSSATPISSGGFCNIYGNVYIYAWAVGNADNYKKMVNIYGGVAIYNPNGAYSDIPIFPDLLKVHAGTGIGTSGNSVGASWRGGGSDIVDEYFAGIVIHQCNGVKELTAGDGVGNNNVRYPNFPVLEFASGIMVTGNHDLNYFDTAIFPMLYEIGDAGLHVSNERFITVARFRRLMHMGGAVVLNNVVIKNEQTCADRGLITYDGGAESTDKRKMGACKCSNSPNFEVAESPYTSHFLDYYWPDAFGRKLFYPVSSMCRPCLSCNGIQINCGEYWDTVCTAGGGIGTTAPTYTTISPTSFSDAADKNDGAQYRDEFGGIGKIHGPFWNLNFTTHPFMLMEQNFKVAQKTGFKLWFKTEHNVPRNGYIMLLFPLLVAEIVTDTHLRCNLWADWHQHVMGENIINNYDTEVSAGTSIKITIGDQGIIQEKDYMLHCLSFDINDNDAFKFLEGNTQNPGDSATTRLRTYTPSGVLIDENTNVFVPLW